MPSSAVISLRLVINIFYYLLQANAGPCLVGKPLQPLVEPGQSGVVEAVGQNSPHEGLSGPCREAPEVSGPADELCVGALPPRALEPKSRGVLQIEENYDS